MKYICFGYLDVQSWEGKSPAEQNAMVDQCFAYDDTLKKNGHWAGGEGLQGATTLAWQDGKVTVSDGPYAETKEFLAGIYVVECDTVEQALAYARRHPGAAMGTVEVRPLVSMEAG